MPLEVIQQRLLSTIFPKENPEGRTTNIFNAESYLNNYADLKNAFGNDHELATKHYVENGFNEGRLLLKVLWKCLY